MKYLHPQCNFCNKFLKDKEYTLDQCRTCWNIYHNHKFAKLFDKQGNGRVQLEVVRRNRCDFLARRTEFKAGCGGWKCKHDCEKGFPAVPGGYCQSCEHYIDSGEVF